MAAVVRFQATLGGRGTFSGNEPDLDGVWCSVWRRRCPGEGSTQVSWRATRVLRLVRWARSGGRVSDHDDARLGAGGTVEGTARREGGRERGRE
eukprot:2466228-Rhodomonas_salina.1